MPPCSLFGQDPTLDIIIKMAVMSEYHKVSTISYRVDSVHIPLLSANIKHCYDKYCLNERIVYKTCKYMCERDEDVI